MIKGLYGGRGVVVTNNTSSTPYYSMSSTYSGTVRLNSSNNSYEVFDGNNWLMLTTVMPTIELDGATRTAIDWCHKKMAEEARLDALAAKHPGIKDLKEKLDLMVKLVQEENDAA